MYLLFYSLKNQIEQDFQSLYPDHTADSFYEKWNGLKLSVYEIIKKDNHHLVRDCFEAYPDGKFILNLWKNLSNDYFYTYEFYQYFSSARKSF